jgi:hypothetical protein
MRHQHPVATGRGLRCSARRAGRLRVALLVFVLLLPLLLTMFLGDE